MRPALAVAVAAVCLTLTAVPAFAADIAMGPQLTEQPAATLSTTYQAQQQVAPEVWSRIEYTAVSRPKGALGNSGRLIAKSWSLDYRPFDNGIRFSIGARKDRLGGSRLSRDLLGTGAIGGSGYKRHLIPSAMIGYDSVIDQNNRFSLEGGIRKGGRDSATAQLLRVADLGAGRSHLLAAPSARFAPAVRASFIHSF